MFVILPFLGCVGARSWFRNDKIELGKCCFTSQEARNGQSESDACPCLGPSKAKRDSASSCKLKRSWCTDYRMLKKGKTARGQLWWRSHLFGRSRFKLANRCSPWTLDHAWSCFWCSGGDYHYWWVNYFFAMWITLHSCDFRLPAAGLSTKSPFSHPYHRRVNAYMSKLYWSENAFSDCFALLNVFRVSSRPWVHIHMLFSSCGKLWCSLDLDEKISRPWLPNGSDGEKLGEAVSCSAEYFKVWKFQLFAQNSHITSYSSFI